MIFRGVLRVREDFRKKRSGTLDDTEGHQYDARPA